MEKIINACYRPIRIRNIVSSGSINVFIWNYKLSYMKFFHNFYCSHFRDPHSVN